MIKNIIVTVFLGLLLALGTNTGNASTKKPKAAPNKADAKKVPIPKQLPFETPRGVYFRTNQGLPINPSGKLGSETRPIRCAGARGEKQYLKNLRSKKNKTVQYYRNKTVMGPYGHIADRYVIITADGSQFYIWFDMYYTKLVDAKAIDGFTFFGVKKLTKPNEKITLKKLKLNKKADNADFFGIKVDAKQFSQDTPQKTLASIIKTIKENDFRYMLAHLILRVDSAQAPKAAQQVLFKAIAAKLKEFHEEPIGGKVINFLTETSTNCKLVIKKDIAVYQTKKGVVKLLFAKIGGRWFMRRYY